MDGAVLQIGYLAHASRMNRCDRQSEYLGDRARRRVAGLDRPLFRYFDVGTCSFFVY